MASRALVLDANILIRAVLGNRVRRILEEYAESVSFFIPESAYAEAEEHLASLVTKRGGDPAKASKFS
jgi:predicted nucleic acid-binding protein